MKPTYKITAYYKKEYCDNYDAAVTKARDWAIKTTGWSKIEKIIGHTEKRNREQKKQMYIATFYNKTLTESGRITQGN